MSKRRPLLLLFIFIYSLLPASNDAYHLTIQVKNCPDTFLFLSRYEFNFQRIVDTAKIDRKSQTAVFKGKSTLPNGMYKVSGRNNKCYFDFILFHETKFKLQTDTTLKQEGLTVYGSDENKAWAEYARFMSIKNKELISQQKKQKTNRDSTRKAQETIRQINKQIRAYQQDFTKKYPKYYTTKLIPLQQEPDTEGLSNPKQEDSNVLSANSNYKNHFWDNIDLSDSSIVNNPYFYPRVKKYFDQVVIQNPDSIIRNGQMLVEWTKGNKLVFKYLVHYLTSTYANASNVQMEKVFVEFANTYYRSGQAYWADSNALHKILAAANAKEKSLLGKTAPDLLLFDTSGLKVCEKLGITEDQSAEKISTIYTDQTLLLNTITIRLSEIKADYMLVVFWQHNCKNCETELPLIQHMYDSLRSAEISFQVYAVYTGHDYANWKKFISTHHLHWVNVADVCHNYVLSTLYELAGMPSLYLLDKEKKIIAKRVNKEQIPQIIQQEEQKKRKKKSGGSIDAPRNNNED